MIFQGTLPTPYNPTIPYVATARIPSLSGANKTARRAALCEVKEGFDTKALKVPGRVGAKKVITEKGLVYCQWHAIRSGNSNPLGE